MPRQIDYMARAQLIDLLRSGDPPGIDHFLAIAKVINDDESLLAALIQDASNLVQAAKAQIADIQADLALARTTILDLRARVSALEAKVP